MSEQSVIYRGRQLTVVSETYQLPNGKISEHVTIEHPGAVVILPRDSQGRYVLVRQYRHSMRKILLEAPAGALEQGEEPLSSAQREIREEIGERAQSWTSLGTLYPTPGFCNEVQYLYLATDLISDRIPGDEDEFIEIERLNREQIMDAVRSGELNDGKTLAIILRAQVLGVL